MIMTNVNENQVKSLTEGNIYFLESFEQVKPAFKEKVSKFWFEYCNETGKYPFELAVKITKNWLDETDMTPVVELSFSTIMSNHGNFLCMGNDILKDPSRKEEIQNFYFKFESILLDFLYQQNVPFGYSRDRNYSLFGDYQWFLKNKGITPSGRMEQVENLEFKSSILWSTESEYKEFSILTDGINARQIVRYFLKYNHCDKIVKEFLLHVLSSKKEIRIVKECSHWNYNFAVRPDMLSEDSNTLSRLGINLHFNFDNHEDRLAAMIYAFDLFASHSIVNIYLDVKTAREINDEFKLFGHNPILSLLSIHSELEEKKTESIKDRKYQQFNENYSNFLDGLLDLHIKYKDLYESFGDEKYNRKANRLKNLWVNYSR